MDNSVNPVKDGDLWSETMSNEEDMVENLLIYVMCGGGGTRLWPLSRADNPKQNLQLSGQFSMLEETVGRIAKAEFEGVSTTLNLMGGITQTGFMDGVLRSREEIAGTVVVEPFGKNTAPAVATAALHATGSLNQDPYVLMLPADHVIRPAEKFAKSISAGLKAANDGEIVVFGIEPTNPATGYGYIEVDTPSLVSPVKSFREKPDMETAERYAISGHHLWNAGMFLFRASTMLRAFEKFSPEILDTVQTTLKHSTKENGVVQLDAALFSRVPSDSIDFAIMEHASNVTVVRADFDWHDIGSFASLHNIGQPDENGNVFNGDVITNDCSNSLLHSDGPLVAAIGLENIAVVATADVTLITPLNRSEEIKTIVAGLKEAGRPEARKSPWTEEAGAVPGSHISVLDSWLKQDALPFWAHMGPDLHHGGFHEVLDINGISTRADKRLRTMARQTYVFGKALEMGWTGKAKSLVRHGLDFLGQSPQAPLGGWYRAFDHKCNPNDLCEDIYDHAFVLLALAQAKKIGCLDNNDLYQRVMSSINKLRISGRDGEFHGYAEDGYGNLPRRSNPHMHLLEAFLTWHEASGDETFLTLAGEVVELLQRKFFDQDTLLLSEYFDPDLNPVSSGEILIEPGHHFEWSHLLQRYADQSGNPPVPEIAGLMATAKAYGINPVSGMACDVVGRDGRPEHQTSRCWGQTEMVTAFSVRAARGHDHFRFEAERCAEKLWNHHLSCAPKGMWIDVIDGRGRPISRTVPASTFYHLINCIDQYQTHLHSYSTPEIGFN